MSVFPAIAALENKVNTPERLAQMAAYGEAYFADAELFNLMRDGMMELFTAFQLSGGRRASKTIGDVAYLVEAADYDKQLLLTSDAPVTVTVPAGLDMNIIAFQEGNGQVTFIGDEGVQVIAPVDAYPKTENKGSVVALVRTAPDKYRVIGKLQLI